MCRDIAAQEPSVECNEALKPPVTQNCNTGECSSTSMAGGTRKCCLPHTHTHVRARTHTPICMPRIMS